VFLFREPKREEIDAFLRAQVKSDFSYKQRGLSLKAEAPAAYNVDRNRICLGNGEKVWRAAKAAVEGWKPFAIPWLQLCWPETPIESGRNVAVLVSHLGFWSLNGCRVVAKIDEVTENSKRFGFAYGTLEDHSESGEECFSITWNADDNAAWYEIFAFSRPKAFLARVGYPISRRLQRRFAQSSKEAMLESVSAVR